MKFCFWGNISKGFEGKPMGGGEKQLFLISSELAKRGNSVYIVDFTLEEDVVKDNVHLLSLKKFSKKIKTNKYRALYKLLKSIDADIYYARIRSSIHLVALLAARTNKKKFIYHSAHDLDSATFKQRLKGFYFLTPSIKKIVLHIIHSELLFPVMLRKSNLIFAQNKEQKSRFRKKYPKVKVELINNLFNFEQKNIKNATSSSYDFITVGSLDLRKGVQDLFTLINELPNKRFLVVGKARDKNGLNFIEKIKNNENVTYHTNLDQEKVIELMNSSTFLVTTSKGEGFPNVFLESWSIGTPVLSLNINPSNVIDEFHLGKFYNGSLEEMKKGLLNLTPESFQSSQIIDYVKNNHSPETVINKVEVILKSNFAL